MKFRDIIPIIIISVIAFAILLYTTKSSEGFKVDVSDYVAQLAERNIIMARNASFNTATAPSTQTGGEVLSTQAPVVPTTIITADSYPNSVWSTGCSGLGMKTTAEGPVYFTRDECSTLSSGASSSEWISYADRNGGAHLYNRDSIEVGFCISDGYEMSNLCAVFTEAECTTQLNGDNWISFANYMNTSPLFNKDNIEVGFCSRDSFSRT
jgi:hypothetical protein